MLFEADDLDDAEQAILDWVTGARQDLSHLAGTARVWWGLLRRVAYARALQGSNSIEGYIVSTDDALAAADESEPMDASASTWAAIVGYRNAMTYILQLADEVDVVVDVNLIRSLHYMMLRHDIDRRPGRWRAGAIYVMNERTRRAVYEGPDVGLVPGLMDELVAALNVNPHPSVTIRAAMAHLNLAMIHPFRDGNGRMARALQTLVLSREGIVGPMFCSVEEYLGRHQQEYYDVLNTLGQGSWNPHHSARPWIRFMLTAHYRQAQTLLRRALVLQRLWNEVEDELERTKLPSRSAFALCEAARGAVIRRTTYVSLADVEERTAGRDLQALVDARYLSPEGEKRGRIYRAAAPLQAMYARITEAVGDPHLEDPFEEIERAGALVPAGQRLAGQIS